MWWRAVFKNSLQRNRIRSGLFNLEIFSDASLTGWGAACGGARTHGYWSPEDKQNHINYLELLAIFHALRCFASQLRRCNVLLRVDNSTALSYINCMGSIRFRILSGLARDIWSWCAERDLFIYASYIPSAQNIEADAESRTVSEETEWALEQSYFNRIEAYFGSFDIDLFATSINAKCPSFVSGSSSTGSRCVLFKLEQVLFLCISSVYLDIKIFTEDHHRWSRGGCGRPLVADTTMVPFVQSAYRWSADSLCA